MALHERATTIVGVPTWPQLRALSDADTGDSPSDERLVDRTLELLERLRLSPAELRILLAIRDREVAVAELARRFDRPAVEIRRIAAPLLGRGLLHWRQRDRTRDEARLAITRAGMLNVRPLVTAITGGRWAR